MRDFRDKVAAITGAGSGMGRALALELAARGCAVAIADVGLAALNETESMLRSTKVKVSCHLVDVADRGRVLVGKDAKLLAWIQRLFPENYARRLGAMTGMLMRRD